MAKVSRYDLVTDRRSGKTKTVVGFTTKPDGIRRARLVDDAGKESRVRTDQLGRNYYVES